MVVGEGWWLLEEGCQCGLGVLVVLVSGLVRGTGGVAEGWCGRRVRGGGGWVRGDGVV